MVSSTTSKKVALVTGASSGMGMDFAKALLSEGMVVYAAARRVDQMADLARLGAITLKMDVTSESDLQAAVQRITQDHGGVDVLINNAGFGMYGAMEDTTIEDARYQFEVNLFGMARLTQLLLPAMRNKGTGKIINISSMGGKIYTPLGSWYHATKHAVEGWSDCLRLELAPFGIDVVIVEPGAIRTEWSGIARDGLLAASGHGPYAAQAQAHARLLANAGTASSASPPEVVARTVAKALAAARPRTRYATGGGAKPILFLRAVLPDRMFDGVMRFALAQLAK